MTDWQNIKWGDIATLEYGKSLREYRNSSGEYCVYGTNGAIGWHSQFLYSSASVIIGRKGAYRGVHYSKTPFFVIDTAFYLKSKPNVDFDMKWAYYQLLTQDINGMDSGSAIPSTSRDSFYNLSVSFPPIEEQKAIAKILSSLDDKIELNRRMNRTLEAMARAVFKAWFVDFEPVRANSENRPSESASPEIAKLFPSELENDIPKSWELRELREAFEINPFRKLAKGQTAKFLDMANVPTFGHTIANLSEREFSSGMKFIAGDTLLARITPCLENGKTAFVDFLNNGEVGFGSTEFIVLRPKKLPEYFAYLLSRDDDFRAFAIQSMTGTSGRQRVQTDRLASYKIPLPSNIGLVSEKFGKVLSPIVSRISRNSVETKSLSQIRDSLLPRLISGKIRVGEAEKELAEKA